MMVTGAATGDSLFRPNQSVPFTGVYHAIHHPSHRPTHSVILRGGENFPKCGKCEYTVFLLVSAIPHVTEDEDFRP